MCLSGAIGYMDEVIIQNNMFLYKIGSSDSITVVQRVRRSY